MDVHDIMAARRRAFDTFSEVTRSLASPARLEILDLIVQMPRSLEALAAAAEMSPEACSVEIEVLLRARLVETERRGTTLAYCAAPGVTDLYGHLLKLARERSAEFDQQTSGDYDEITAADLAAKLLAGGILLLDVRETDEFAHAHLPGSLNIPMRELGGRLEELPQADLIVATCRGRMCSFAGLAVQLLQRHGREAVCFEGGIAEWAAGGRPLLTKNS
jgi:rhodanese-related sulfurtransferase/DNA-binding transcriptional ArsR family regulator